MSMQQSDARGEMKITFSKSAVDGASGGLEWWCAPLSPTDSTPECSSPNRWRNILQCKPGGRLMSTLY